MSSETSSVALSSTYRAATSKCWFRNWERNQGRLPFTPSIRVEILGVNIQCSSLSKRKLEKSEDVLVSIGKFKRKRKNAAIKPIAYNFWNVSNGTVCIISFSIQNFRVFRVNRKRPWFRFFLGEEITAISTKLWNKLKLAMCEYKVIQMHRAYVRLICR